MGMVKCGECGAQISGKAKACPTCGAPPRKSRRSLVLFAGLVVAAVVGARLSDRAPAASVEPSAADKAQKARDDAEFLRAVEIARTIRSGVNNPDSFKVSDAFVTADGAMCFEYRGTNSFNAVVPNVAVVPAHGRATSGAPSSAAVAEAWNRHCANKPARALRNIDAVL